MKDLFLVSIGGIRYGVWKDEIQSVRNISALHRIPLSPAKIAGILIDDGKTVTLADLSECIGFANSTKNKEGSILLMEEGETVIGFAVSGEIDTLSIPQGFLLPLPDYLKTPVFESCAVHNGIPIPIIKVAELYSIAMKGIDESSANPPSIAMPHPMDAAAVTQVRFFTAGGERYAMSGTGIDDTPVKLGAVTPLPNMPLYVQGVTFSNGRLLPVIDLSQRIKRQKGTPDAVMLTARIGGEAFGLLVDGDDRTLPAHKVAIRPAPKMARSSWMAHFVMRAGEPVPLVDLAIALSPGSGAADEEPLWQRYTPHSRFPDLFFEQDVDVVEFSLLGERHALPKQEVEDVVPFKPCRIIHDVPPTMFGVAEHNGEILPVLDLAMMFGRRSLAASGWRMMLVSNGDFRALVITETVFKERRLTLDIHRAVPIHLPHDLMYGCYPDAEAVRLIFDVEAIAVHFEKSLIKKFLPALSQGMKMKSEKAEPVPEPEPLQQAGVKIDYTTDVQEAVTEARIIEPEPEQPYFTHAAFSQEVKQGTLTSSGKWSESDADEAVEQKSFPIAGKAPEEMIADEPAIGAQSPGEEYMDSEEIEQAALNLQTAAKLEQQNKTENFGFTRADNKVAEPEIISEQKSEEIFPKEIFVELPSNDRPIKEPGRKIRAKASAHVKPKQEGSKEKPEALLTRDAAALASDGHRSSGQIFSAESAGSGVPYRMGQNVEREGEQHRVSKVPGKSDAGGWTRRVVYGAITAALVALLYAAGSSRQQVFERPLKVTGPVKIEQIQAQPEQARTVAEDTKAPASQANAERETKAGQETKSKATETLVLSPLPKAQTEPPQPAETSRPTLELDIPKNRPTDIDVYVVQEGDTLWSISERFTGSPYNYLRIAGENRIADPDLIFPEQRIRLIK